MQRVCDVEREDALDLLALLVDRSLDFNNSTKRDGKFSPSDNAAVDLSKVTSVGNFEDGMPSSTILKDSFEALCQISNEYEKNEEHGFPSHDKRMIVLNRLMDSHTYAMEMKQAALSASTWLSAIGRYGDKPISTSRFDGIQYSQYISEERLQQLDVKDLRSLVHAAHSQLLEKMEVHRKLETELASCRAEIGQLKIRLSKTEVRYVSSFLYAYVKQMI